LAAEARDQNDCTPLFATLKTPPDRYVELIHPRIGKKTSLIDSSIEVAGALKNFLINNPAVEKSLEQTGKNLYYVSDTTSTAESIAEKIFSRPIQLIKT
jgi:glutamate racemase